MTEVGHRYSFGAPSVGWPEFDSEGRVVRPAIMQNCDECFETFTTYSPKTVLPVLCPSCRGDS